MSTGSLPNIPTHFSLALGGAAEKPRLTSKQRRRRRGSREVYFEALEHRELLDGSPPTVQSFTLTVGDNSIVQITESDFANNYSDDDTTQPAQVEIATLPTNGTLTLTVDTITTDVSPGQIINASDIEGTDPGDGLYYDSGSITGDDSFQWDGSDGANFSGNPATVTMDVQGPSIVDINKSLTVNNPYVFTSDDFNNAYSGADSLQSVDIQSLPVDGTLTFNGATFTTNACTPEVIPITQISGLLYTPNLGFTGSDAFSWAASDGNVLSNSANVNFTIAGDLNGISKTVLAGNPVVFVPNDFIGSYNSGNPLQSITITSLPGDGELTLTVNSSTSAIAANQVIAAAELNGITYTPNTNFVGSDSFTFTATDGTNISNSATVTLTVNSYYTAINKTLDKNLPLDFAQSDFTSSFATTLQSIEIMRLPSFGSLMLTVGSATSKVTNGEVIPVAELGGLAYKPPANFVGADTVLWEGTDGTGYKGPPGQITIAISSPVVSAIATSDGQNLPLNFTESQFAGAFSGAAGFATLKILSLPSHGTLTLTVNSVATPVTVNETLSAVQVSSLVYTPATGFLGSDSFKWTASDGQAFAAGSANVDLAVTGLTVTGNNVSITNGDSSPSATDFTDFAGTAIASESGPTLTRTYVITNTTGGTINLTGGGNLVGITGPAATAFTLTTPPANTLAPNATTSFTIAFLPLSKGLQRATLTIPNDTPGSAAFTFSIEGTGLIASVVASSSQLTSTTQTFSDSQVLMVASTHPGKGSVGAVNGDVVYLSYTGTLLDGTVFDASTLHDNVPIAIRLDDTASANHVYVTNAALQATNSTYANLNTFATQVIDGWNFGLQGIKPGETRTLIIPADFGYGSDGSNGIPGGATLIFTVTCDGIADTPSWGISESNGFSTTSVFPGEKSPSTTNGTDFGVLPAGQAYVGESFIGTNNSPVNASGIPLAEIENTGFQITGPDAKDFIATGTFTNFNLYFKPNAPGVRTATINFLTTDPGMKDFSFEVRGESSPYVDLLFSAVGAQAFPATTLNNGNVQTTIPVVVENFGNSAVPASTPTTDVSITAYNTTDTTSAPVVLGTISNASFAGLGADKTKSFNVPVTIPASLAQDSYNLVLSVNSSQGIAEAVTTNDSATTSENISGSLVSTTIPSHVVDTANSVNGNVVVTVQNSGQFTLPSNETVSVQIQAFNASTNTTIALGTPMVFSVKGMAANGSQTFTIPVNSTATLADGLWQIQAVVTPSPFLPESSTADNTITTTSSGGALSTTAEPAGIDLVAAFGTALSGGASSSHGNIKFSLPVVITNNGSIPVSATASTTDVEIVLQDLNSTGSSGTVIGSIPAQSLKGLAPDHSMAVNVPVTVPANMTTSIYTYEVEVNTAQNAPITDTDMTNNTATTSMNLAGNLISTDLPGTITHTAPATRGIVYVNLTNSGIIAFPSGVSAKVQIVAVNTSNGVTVVIGTATTSDKDFAAVSSAATESYKVTIPHNMSTGTYQIEAQLSLVPNMPQLATADDLLTLNGSGAPMKLVIS